MLQDQLSDNTYLALLSQELGIESAFKDSLTNIIYEADDESKQAICQSLGYPASNEEEAQLSLNRFKQEELTRFAPFSTVIKSDINNEESTVLLSLELHILKEENNKTLFWSFCYETGEEINDSYPLSELETTNEVVFNQQTFLIKRFELLIDKDYGYHKIEFKIDNQLPQTNHQTHIILAPTKCYFPLKEYEKVFGFPIQLYAIKSQTNFGIGDFTDLKKVIEIAYKSKASFIGINPLNALFSDNPNDASPYFPSSRLFLNPLYVDLDSTPESDDESYQSYRNDNDTIQEITKLRGVNLIDYQGVASIKNKGFCLLNKAFKERNLDIDFKAKTKRGQDYLDFKKHHALSLEKFCVFQALRNHFSKTNGDLIWRQWAESYQSFDNGTLKAFCDLHQEDIDLICYQQFLAFEQFNEVIHLSKKLKIGLYTDLPVGVSDNSADVWANPDNFLHNVTTGAPADLFNKDGQDWSLAPFNPIKLKKTGFQPFKDVLKFAMKGAGAIRIDHAFGLMRLYLRVKGASGAYLKYPFEEMCAILALESHRQQCIIIGEDLGTAPEGFFDKMNELGALSFKIMHYQTTWDNHFILPQDYQKKAIVTTGTHDMPTYPAFFKGIDLELALLMGTISQEQYQLHKKERQQYRKNYIELFEDLNLLSGQETEIDIYKNAFLVNDMPTWFIPHIHQVLSMCASQLILVRLEDILNQEEQINLPGTYLEYPNWRYKLPCNIENLTRNKSFQNIIQIIQQNRK